MYMFQWAALGNQDSVIFDGVLWIKRFYWLTLHWDAFISLVFVIHPVFSGVAWHLRFNSRCHMIHWLCPMIHWPCHVIYADSFFLNSNPASITLLFMTWIIKIIFILKLVYNCQFTSTSIYTSIYLSFFLSILLASYISHSRYIYIYIWLNNIDILFQHIFVFILSSRWIP